MVWGLVLAVCVGRVEVHHFDCTFSMSADSLRWHLGKEGINLCGLDEAQQGVILSQLSPVYVQETQLPASSLVHQQNVFLSLEASRSVWEDVECKLRCVNFRRVSDTRREFLPAVRVTGSADFKPGSTWERWGHTWERQQHAREHLESQQSSLGKTTSSLGTLLVHLEIIATVFSLYSHLCIFVSMYLYSYSSTHGISGLATGGEWEQFKVRLKMMIEWTHRYTARPWSSEFGDPIGGGNQTSLEAVIVQV